MTEHEEELFEKMERKLKEQDQKLRQLLTAPTQFAVVVRVAQGKAVFVTNGGSMFEGLIPQGSVVRAGSVVKTIVETGAIVEVDRQSIDVGNMATVVKQIDTNHAEIETENGRKVALISSTVTGLKPGHRVLLDNTSSIITRTYGSDKEQFKAPAVQKVAWSDIGGLEEAKRLLREAIELPVSNPKIFAKYGRKPLKGIMLYGPPGCGKTLLGKAAYTSVAALHGADTVASGFIYVKGPEILNKWVGESEALIRGIFHRAREHFNDNGFPAIVFLDEADAILGKRGRDMHSGMSSTIVPQFLSEMDGLDPKGQPLVLIATNRPDSLDPAVVRDGRVDRKIKIERPQMKEVGEIFKICLKGKPSLNLNELAEHGAKELMCDTKVMVQVVDTHGRRHPMTLASAVNGAMVAGIVDRATELAMRRELAGKGSGITKEDITSGVDDNLRQMADIDITDEVQHFSEMKKIDVAEILRYVQ